MIAEEAFFGADAAPLFDWVRDTAAMVRLPVHRSDDAAGQSTIAAAYARSDRQAAQRDAAGASDTTVTLVSTAKSALRARLRQYEAANYLAEREQAAARLEQLVAERTRQLQQANDRLTAAQESLTMALDAAQMRTWNVDLARHALQNLRRPVSARLFAEWSESVGERILDEDLEAFDAALRESVAERQIQPGRPALSARMTSCAGLLPKVACTGTSEAVRSGWPVP